MISDDASARCLWYDSLYGWQCADRLSGQLRSNSVYQQVYRNYLCRSQSTPSPCDSNLVQEAVTAILTCTCCEVKVEARLSNVSSLLPRYNEHLLSNIDHTTQLSPFQPYKLVIHHCGALLYLWFTTFLPLVNSGTCPQQPRMSTRQQHPSQRLRTVALA